MWRSHVSLSQAPDEWQYARQQCSEFFRRYSNKRLTREGYQRLASLSYDELLQPGTSIMAATVRSDIGRIPVGICFAADYGEGACMIAVHPLYRGRISALPDPLTIIQIRAAAMQSGC